MSDSSPSPTLNPANFNTRVTTDQLGNTIVGAVNDYESDSHLTSLPPNGHVLQSDEIEKGSIHAKINDLPFEVLVQIFSQLDPIQLSSLRLVCKHWNHAVSDRTTWIRSFSAKFGTGNQFPSVSQSRYWIVEYFNRMRVSKKWNKAVATHKTYQLINNEFGLVDYLLTNFDSDRLLTFSSRTGNISIASLNSGKNQTFIPGSHLFTSISSYAMNWNYLLVGKLGGELYLKNLITSTNSGSTRLSLITLIGESSQGSSEIITATAINSKNDKHKEAIDLISASSFGSIKLWNLSGKLIQELNVDECIFNIKCDFRRVIVAQGAQNIYIINFHTFEITQLEIGLGHQVGIESCFMDVDFGGCNVIISNDNLIKVVNYQNLQNPRYRQLLLDEDVVILKAKLQTCSEHRLINYDDKLIGGDDLLYVNVLSNDTVIIWNVRDTENSDIKIQTIIDPIFNKHHPQLPEGANYITAVAINSMVVVISAYNGFTNIYNVYTGEYLREASIKYPKKYSHMYTNLIPTIDVQLSTNQKSTVGVITCGDTVQYFQYGALEPGSAGANTNGSSNTKKRLNVGPSVSNKQITFRDLKDQMDDFEIEEYKQNEANGLLNKYNGHHFEDEEEELSMALALSESVKHKSEFNDLNEEEQLRLVMEMSKQEQEHKRQLQRNQWGMDDYVTPDRNSHSEGGPSSVDSTVPISSTAFDVDHGSNPNHGSFVGTTSEEDEEEQLRRIIELSLSEQ